MWDNPKGGSRLVLVSELVCPEPSGLKSIQMHRKSLSLLQADHSDAVTTLGVWGQVVGRPSLSGL